MALWLSHPRTGAFPGIPNPLHKWANQMASLEASVAEMYAASVVKICLESSLGEPSHGS